MGVEKVDHHNSVETIYLPVPFFPLYTVSLGYGVSFDGPLS